MEEKQMKECKSCYQQIDIRAKRCHYCHCWQTKFSAFIHHPLSSIIYIVLVFVGFYAFVEFINNRTMEFDNLGYGGLCEYKEFSVDSGLIIKSHKGLFPTKDSFNVVAEVANTGSDAWDFINVNVDLFDKEGKFLCEGSERIDKTLYPGGAKTIVVSCSSCEKEQVLEFDHYTIKIRSASYRPVKK